jgi:hypothetical protein
MEPAMNSNRFATLARPRPLVHRPR